MKKMQIENQKGSAILISVVVLLTLTVLGLSAIRNTGMELQIAANNKVYQRNLFAADGAVREPIQRIAILKNANPGQLENLTPGWLHGHNTDITDTTQWNDTNSNVTQFVDSTGNTKFAVTDNGIAHGASLSLSDETNLHSFCTYGISKQNNTATVVEIGYLERF